MVYLFSLPEPTSHPKLTPRPKNVPHPRSLLKLRLVRNRQFMTTLCTTGSQYLTAIGGLHPLAETVDRLTAASVWLKCTLHE